MTDTTRKRGRSSDDEREPEENDVHLDLKRRRSEDQPQQEESENKNKNKVTKEEEPEEFLEPLDDLIELNNKDLGKYSESDDKDSDSDSDDKVKEHTGPEETTHKERAQEQKAQAVSNTGQVYEEILEYEEREESTEPKKALEYGQPDDEEEEKKGTGASRESSQLHSDAEDADKTSKKLVDESEADLTVTGEGDVTSSGISQRPDGSEGSKDVKESSELLDNEKKSTDTEQFSDSAKTLSQGPVNEGTEKKDAESVDSTKTSTQAVNVDKDVNEDANGKPKQAKENDVSTGALTGGSTDGSANDDKEVAAEKPAEPEKSASASTSTFGSGPIFGSGSGFGSGSAWSSLPKIDIFASAPKTTTDTDSSSRPEASSSFASFASFGSNSGFASYSNMGSGSGSKIASVFTPSTSSDSAFGSKPSDGDNQGEDKDKDNDNQDQDGSVTFQEQKIQTGEETEESVFSCRAKLYAFDVTAEPKAWKERGAGMLHVNVQKSEQEEEKEDDKDKDIETRKGRLVMRCEGSLRVILNLPLVKNTSVTKGTENSFSSEKFVRVTGIEDQRPIQYAIRVRTADLATELYDAVAQLIPGEN